MTTMNLYWLIKLDDFRELLCGIGISVGIIAVVSSFAFFISLIVLGVAGKETVDGKSAFRIAKASGWFFFPSMILVFIMSVLYYGLPTTKQMAAIIIVPRIVNAAANSPELQKIPNKIIVLAGDWLEELRPEAAKVKDAIKPEISNVEKSVVTAKKVLKIKTGAVKSAIEKTAPVEKDVE